ncbi:MAG: ABC transporter substrate-binding protein [Balneolaceae bacterium]
MIKGLIFAAVFLFGGSSGWEEISLYGLQENTTPEQEIRIILEERDAQIKQLVGPAGTEHSEEQREKLQQIINGMIDFRRMASEALRGHFDEIESVEREEFIDLFSKIVRDQSMNRLDIYRAEVSYNEIEVEESEALVKTVVKLDNVQTPVHYTMVREEGEWRITDMIIDEVSTTGSYQRQFQSIIRQRGFDALMESLRRRASRI